MRPRFLLLLYAGHRCTASVFVCRVPVEDKGDCFMCFGGGGGVAGDEVAAEFFFSLLSYSLLLPLVSRRRGGGRTPLIKKIVKIAIGCMPRFFGRRARDAARGRGDNSFSFPFSF